MRVFYGKPHRNPAAKDVVIYNVKFSHESDGVHVPTDLFLQALTGVPSNPRCCLYVPLEPSPPFLPRQREGYIPRILTEGKMDGEDAGWDSGLDRMEAVRRAYEINRQDGFSNLDIADIVAWYRRAEPDPNAEPEFEFYPMSED